MPETKTIGLIGGLGPAATVHYYNGLIEESRRLGGSLRLIVNQACVDLVLDAAARGDTDALAEHLVGRMHELERAGAQRLAIAAVTPHMCRREIADRTSVPIIDVINLVAADLLRRGVQRVGLMGTRTTVTTRLFGGLAHVAVDPTTDQIKRVHDLYVGIVARGSVGADTALALREIAAEYVDRLGVEEIVLAGTELALVPRETWDGLKVVDCAALHISEIVAQALER